MALCSRNTSNWGIAFLATLTYGAVAVPILNEFKPDSIRSSPGCWVENKVSSRVVVSERTGLREEITTARRNRKNWP